MSSHAPVTGTLRTAEVSVLAHHLLQFGLLLRSEDLKELRLGLGMIGRHLRGQITNSVRGLLDGIIGLC